MTTGVTIVTGGVPAFVLMAEAQSATNVSPPFFGKKGSTFMLYEELKAIPPKEIVAILEGNIFSVLDCHSPNRARTDGKQYRKHVESDE